MTRAIEEVIAHINRRISTLEHELERLQDVRKGITEGRGPLPLPKNEPIEESNRKVA